MTLAASRTREAGRPDWLDEDLLQWLEDFERVKGRALRVLHAGNIANNAYLNAKFLRMVGVDADVMSHDYYDVFATPEWEDAPFQETYRADGTPDWASLDLRRYERPAWFVDGPFLKCAGKLDVRRSSGSALGAQRWLRSVRWALVRARRGAFGRALVKALRAIPKARGALWRLRNTGPFRRKEHRDEYASGPVERFRQVFPSRSDELSAKEIHPYMVNIGHWRRVLRHYDVIQAYATEPVHIYISGEKDYVAYEHGTLRTFTMGDDPLHRLTALAYREAAHVFITNGDCFAYAEKLGISQASPMVHPIDVDLHEQGDVATQRIRDAYGAEVLLVCPIRHDWEIKGVDIHLRALPLLRNRIKGRLVVVLFRWGSELQRSEELIAELGCADMVRWSKPLGRQALVRYLAAADVVLDQMTLPHFGATAPQALAAGAPVIMSYEPESTYMIAEEPAPILSARTPEEVAAAVVTALDPAWLSRHRSLARQWVHRYHHPRRIVQEHLRVYRKIVEQKMPGAGQGRTGDGRR